MTALSIVIVSFNTRDTTLRCLDALFARTELAHEVIVVDNASADGSVEAIASRFPTIRVIANATNVGFGPANNQAINVASGQSILLLNSDAFVHDGSIEYLTAALAAHPEAGIVAPKLLNADETLQPSVWPFPTPMRSWVEALGLSRLIGWNWSLRDWRRWAHDEERSVPWAIGACLLVRREVIDQVGAFDESFFLYGEETDWEHRVRNAGWDIRFVPSAVVTHIGGASGMSEKARTRGLFFDGLDRYSRKHYGLIGLVATRAAIIVGGLLRLPVFAMLRIVRPRDARNALRVDKAAWLVRRQLVDWRCLRRDGAA